MARIRFGAAAALALALAVATAGTAAAKGESYIVGAEVSGGGIDGVRRVTITLPENYDDMFEVESAGRSALTYAITIEYDFREFGGKRTWAGRFDGNDVLFFPESMHVGNGTWQAGWYRASAELAAQISPATHGPSLPSAGAGSPSNAHARSIRVVSVLGLLVLILAGATSSRAVRVFDHR